jgi:DNA-binding XRE family transcriptional regulator
MDGRQDHADAAGSGGRSLREHRMEQQMSVRELAWLAGVAPSTIHLIESGRSLPQLASVRALVTALDVEPRDVTEFQRAIHRSSRYHPSTCREVDVR